MTELLAAIQVAWAADATLSLVPAPFLGFAKDGASYPNADYNYVPGAPPAYHFDRTIIENTDLQFRIRTTSETTAFTYSRALDDLLNKPATKLASEAPVAVMSQLSRHAPFIRAYQPYGPSGETVYEAVHTYRFQTHRDLP